MEQEKSGRVIKDILLNSKGSSASSTNKSNKLLTDILLRGKGDWGTFLKPFHKKVVPIIIPSLALGYVFYQAFFFFMGGEVLVTLKGKIFLIALSFVYLWFVSLFFMLSALVYTIIDVKQSIKQKPITDRLETMKAQ